MKLNKDQEQAILKAYDSRIESGLDHETAVKGVLVVVSEELHGAINELLKELAERKNERN